MNKNEKFVITINREVGTGGRTVGRKLAEKLDVKYCDKAVIDGLTQKFGLSPERIEEIKAQKKSWWNDINNYGLYQSHKRKMKQTKLWMLVAIKDYQHFELK